MRYSRLKKSFHGHIPTRRERTKTGVSKRRKSSNDKPARGVKVEKNVVKKEEDLPSTPAMYDENSNYSPLSSPAEPLLKAEDNDEPLPNYDPIRVFQDKFDHGSEYGFLNHLPNFPLSCNAAAPTTQFGLPYRSIPRMDVENSEMEFNKLMNIHEAAQEDDVIVKQEPRWEDEYERCL